MGSLAFDARGYLTSHQKRTCHGQVTSGQAKAQGEARMQVERVRPTVIPMAVPVSYCWSRGTSTGGPFGILQHGKRSRREDAPGHRGEDGTYTM